MYGVEASTGLGGLAATAPAGYAGLGRALAIKPAGAALIGGPPQSGSVLPNVGRANSQVALPASVSPDGSSVERSPHLGVGSWREVLDWHGSPAPWILAAILAFYSWTHLSVRASRR